MVLTIEEMRRAEAAAIAAGISAATLMENAGKAATSVIREKFDVTKHPTVILVGKGNNGGDGLIVARELHQSGTPVTVILVDGPPTASPAAEVFVEVAELPIEMLRFSEEMYLSLDTVRHAGLLVDAVFGIGFHGDLPESLHRLFDLVNARTCPLVALDIPSGMNADSGDRAPHSIYADLTVTFAAAKPALEGTNMAAGEIVPVHIGIADAILIDVSRRAETIGMHLVKPHFTPRPADSHKGSYGRLLAVCGSYRMPGAAVLAAQAALRCGVGLYVAAMPQSAYPLVASHLTEPVFVPLSETGDGTVAKHARPLLREQAAKADAILIGPGLGRGDAVETVVLDLLEQATCPVILDADGINAIAAHIDRLKTVNVPVIITPHPAEMARLCGLSVEQVQADRIGVARRFADTYGATVVLKGHRTVITAPHVGLYENPTGNPGMATGGSGDVLAGMIASFVAQGMDTVSAAICGTYLHGAAGDHAASVMSQHAMLPRDIIDALGGLFLILEK